MIEYGEYIRGRRQHASVINGAELFQERGGLKPSVFYPMIPFRDDEESFPVAQVMRLPKVKAMVCERPGEEPEERMLYAVEDWAYEVNATDGQPGG